LKLGSGQKCGGYQVNNLPVASTLELRAWAYLLLPEKDLVYQQE